MSEEKQPERIEFEEELHRYHEARPFVPFDIVTTDGNTYPIREAAQFAFGQNAVVIVMPRTGVHIVRKNQITSMHIHEPA